MVVVGYWWALEQTASHPTIGLTQVSTMICYKTVTYEINAK